MVSVNVLWMALKLQIEGSISGYEPTWPQEGEGWVRV